MASFRKVGLGLRRLEQGTEPALRELDPANRAVLEVLREQADAAFDARDPQRYTEQAVHFHLRNAESWGNAKTGVDLATQVDRGFTLGPARAGRLDAAGV
ncbi:hypothetical protein GCM10020229_48340 [Kitasatospora albolonga]|uniref:hypothetical protein n=1 Tax=Kitasatospora albolonga TaxID=68173 RepID=UPI0031F04D92